MSTIVIRETAQRETEREKLPKTNGERGWRLTVERYRLRIWEGERESLRGQLKCDGTHAETIFRLSAKRTSPFKPAGASVQSTTGSRVGRISGSNVGYTMFRGTVKGTGYPLHSPVSPSLPLPCVNWNLLPSAHPETCTMGKGSLSRRLERTERSVHHTPLI